MPHWLLVTVAHFIWAAAAAPAPAATLGETIVLTQPKMVKIHGVGGYRGLEPYQSGFLISANGEILTVWSYVLDTESIDVILNDGRRFEATLVGADPQLEIAVLKIEADDLPHFDLVQAVTAEEGSRVLAFSNIYGVATGDEQVSVLHGVVSAVTTLAGRRGAFETPYRGSVYVVDAMTNNPGGAGGALTNSSGALLGIVGKELRNARSNTWLNYSIPIGELLPAVERIRAGQAAPPTDAAEQKADRPLRLALLGIALVPNVLERTPPFVDAVRAGSPAEAAGVLPDDLVVFVDDELVQSGKGLQAELALREEDEAVQITLLRGQELVQVTLQAPAEDER